jgi:hypothetical protein
MRFRKFAHVLERIGPAMAGAASGLFVGIHVGSSITALTSQAFLANPDLARCEISVRPYSARTLTVHFF